MTLKAQPPRKRRPGVGRQLMFSESDGTYILIMDTTIIDVIHKNVVSLPPLEVSIHELVGRARAENQLNLLAQFLFDHKFLRNLLIMKVVDVINNECLDLCRRSQPSIFHHSHPSEYKDFQWVKYATDLESQSPVLLQL